MTEKMTCTWQGCTMQATHIERADNGRPWAYLCEDHHAELEKALIDLKIPQLLSVWVKAQGGAKAAAARL